MSSKPPLYGPISLQSIRMADKPPAATLAPAPKTGEVCQSCPLEMNLPAGKGPGAGGAPPTKTPIEYCDIKQLSITLNQQDHAQTIIIDRNRKPEPPHPKAPSAYKGYLVSHDLVIEALSDLMNTQSDVHVRALATSPSTTDSSKSLKVDLLATNEFSHTSFGPAHPQTTAQVDGAAPVVTHGGAKASATYHARVDAVLGPGFAAWNPFNKDKITTQDLIGSACGNRPIPQRAEIRRSAKLVVLPYEEITIEFGIKAARYSRSHEVDGFAEKEMSAKGKPTGRTITKTTVDKTMKGNSYSSKTLEEMRTQSGAKRRRLTNADGTMRSEILGRTETNVVSEVAKSWDKRNAGKKTTEEEGEFESAKIKLTRKIGGVESSGDIGKMREEALSLYEKMKKGEELFNSLSNTFNKAKIGFSFSWSVEVLTGDLLFGYGNRWPASYSEAQRIYYIERYVMCGGRLNLFDGNLGAFWGLLIDPWFLPVKVEVGLFVDIKASATIAAEFNYAWTGPGGQSAAGFKVPVQATIGAEGGAKANGAILGYSVASKLVLESELLLELKAEIGSDTPFYVESSFRVGKEALNKGEAPAGLRFVGELVFTGWTIQTYRLEPRTLIDGKQFWKDYPLIGKKPAESWTDL